MEKPKQGNWQSYRFGQVLGAKQQISKVQEEDIITKINFDHSGKYLSLGDNAGRIVIFQVPQQSKKQLNEFAELKFYAQFQSHYPKFDYFQNNQVDEGIVDVSWLRNQGHYLKFLTTNSQQIKLWKAYEKPEKKILKSATQDLHMPKLQTDDSQFYASEQKLFPNIHKSPIHSISPSNNQEYLLSSDMQRNYLWSLEKPKKPHIIHQIPRKKQQTSYYDTKTKMTCSKMHPNSDNLFVFGLNRNGVGVCDMRISSEGSNIMNFGVETRSTKNFFTQMISSVSSAQFLPNSRYLVAREYLNIKIWDIANTKKPVINVNLDNRYKQKLYQLQEKQKISDTFQMGISSDSSTILTGNYNSRFHIVDSQTGSNCQYQLSFKKKTLLTPILPKHKLPEIQKLETKTKTSAVAFHPKNNVVAIASLNCLFLYHMENTQKL